MLAQPRPGPGRSQAGQKMKEEKKKGRIQRRRLIGRGGPELEPQGLRLMAWRNSTNTEKKIDGAGPAGAWGSMLMAWRTSTNTEREIDGPGPAGAWGSRLEAHCLKEEYQYGEEDQGAGAGRSLRLKAWGSWLEEKRRLGWTCSLELARSSSLLETVCFRFSKSWDWSLNCNFLCKNRKRFSYSFVMILLY